MLEELARINSIEKLSVSNKIEERRAKLDSYVSWRVVAANWTLPR